MELNDVVGIVRERADYLRCTTVAPSHDRWVPCGDLVGDPDLLRAEIAATASGRGTEDLAVAASLYVQAYAFRLPSIAVAAFALGLPVPSVEPASTALRTARHRPAELALLDPRLTAVDAGELVERLLPGHLEPLVATAHEAVRVGHRLLWGNVAASLATIFRAVQSSGPLGDPDVRRRADEFFAAAQPWLAGLGDWSIIEVPDALGWFWTRTSCCLWYQTTSGFTCDDCSLHDDTALAAQRRGTLIGESA